MIVMRSKGSRDGARSVNLCAQKHYYSKFQSHIVQSLV